MNFIGWTIVISEISFWIFILAGLFARYILKRKKLGLILLTVTPVIDFTLLFATSIDMYRGATASTAHSLAAVYIGVSLAFGKDMIKWADERFQYYLMKQGTKPTKLYGAEYSRHYLKGWIKHALAFVIGCSILFSLITFINDPVRTEALSGVMNKWVIVLLIDLIIGISYFVFPKKIK